MGKGMGVVMASWTRETAPFVMCTCGELASVDRRGLSSSICLAASLMEDEGRIGAHGSRVWITVSRVAL